MSNLRIFGIWDLTFGSGMQTLGALLAVLTVGWFLDRATVLHEIGDGPTWRVRLLIIWLRWVIPAAMLTIGTWWLLSDVLGLVGTS